MAPGSRKIKGRGLLSSSILDLQPHSLLKEESKLAEDANTSDPFDVRTITLLARLMSRHDLNEIDLRQGERIIRLRRGAKGVVASVPESRPAAETQPPNAPRPEQEPAEAKPTSQLVEIKSPTVGTFYDRPKPEAGPYVSVGSRVTPSTVVCLIEAMKLFNEVTADCSGVITKIAVSNEQPVEYNTVLFLVDPTG